MLHLITFLVALTVVNASSNVTIIEYNPANATVVSGVRFPVVLTFSDSIEKGDGAVVFKNDFGDEDKVTTNSTSFVFNGTTISVSLSDKYYYGSSYSIYFEGTPVLDLDGEPILLPEGVYSFTIDSKDNGPMLLGIGIGMGIMLVLIFVA